MKMYKLMAILAALSLAMFAYACEADDAAETTGGGNTPTNPCTTCPQVAGSSDLTGDGNCNTSSYYDADCRNTPKASLQIACGKTGKGCDWTPNVCESFQPCGTVYVQQVGLDYFMRAQACPIDNDCIVAGGEAPHACTQDGHCDTWCPKDPVNTGISIDGDCNTGGSDPQPISDAAAYCAGGGKYDQC